MRSVDDRVAAVRNRTKKLRRRRNGKIPAVLACLMALPLVDLAGRTAAGGSTAFPAEGIFLFGSTSLFGSSVGGYVLVALASFVIAVAITLIVLKRRKIKTDEKPPSDEHDENG